MIEVNQGVHLVQSEWYASTIKGSQAATRNNKGWLLINNSQEAVSFRARIWLMVATRLQMQHSTFWLRTSSNTPSILMNVAQGSFCNSEDEMRFPSYSFRLKKCLCKPVQFRTRLQFVQAYWPVWTNPQLSFTHKDLGSQESLLALWRCLSAPT
jgi:hypothetical protein